MTAVGSSEPQPDSTKATPRPSPRSFSTYTWGTEAQPVIGGWLRGRLGGAQRGRILTSLQFSLLEKWSRSPLCRWPGPAVPWLGRVPTWLGSMPLSRRNCL
jgi:hypothetical protein